MRANRSIEDTLEHVSRFLRVTELKSKHYSHERVNMLSVATDTDGGVVQRTWNATQLAYGSSKKHN